MILFNRHLHGDEQIMYQRTVTSHSLHLLNEVLSWRWSSVCLRKQERWRHFLQKFIKNHLNVLLQEINKINYVSCGFVQKESFNAYVNAMKNISLYKIKKNIWIILAWPHFAIRYASAKYDLTIHPEGINVCLQKPHVNNQNLLTGIISFMLWWGINKKALWPAWKFLSHKKSAFTLLWIAFRRISWEIS